MELSQGTLNRMNIVVLLQVIVDYIRSVSYTHLTLPTTLLPRDRPLLDSDRVQSEGTRLSHHTRMIESTLLEYSLLLNQPIESS